MKKPSLSGKCSVQIVLGSGVDSRIIFWEVFCLAAFVGQSSIWGFPHAFGVPPCFGIPPFSSYDPAKYSSGWQATKLLLVFVLFVQHFPINTHYSSVWTRNTGFVSSNHTHVLIETPLVRNTRGMHNPRS